MLSTETKDEQINFELFQEKPLYKLTNDLYVPITRKFMQDQIFSSLLYRIKSCYDENDVSFRNILGYLFEEYVGYIFRNVISNVKLEYNLISQFKYGPKKAQKDSSDLIVTINDDVLYLN